MLALYYGIGRFISANMRNRNWGKGVLAQFSERLKSELPGLRGFGERHLKNMRTFYEEWSMLEPNSAIPIAETLNTSVNEVDTITTMQPQTHPSPRAAPQRASPTAPSTTILLFARWSSTATSTSNATANSTTSPVVR